MEEVAHNRFFRPQKYEIISSSAECDFLYFCRIILKPVSMKKNIIFCLCVAVIALFSACSKDPEGVYNPSKKIQKIYEVNDNGVKELKEVWNWDGDRLTSINCVDESYSYTMTFSYDSKNRLVTIEEGGSRSEFIYDGKYIQKIVSTSAGIEVGTMEFEHEKGKISVIKISDIFGGDDWEDKVAATPLRLMIPEAYPALEKAIQKCSKEAKGDPIILKLNWKGDNVSSMDITVSSWGTTMTETAELTYDIKNNPMYGLFASIGSDVATNLFLNKNNPLTMKYTYMGIEMSSSDFTYEYEGNYPTKVTCKTVEDGETDTDTTIYEY